MSELNILILVITGVIAIAIILFLILRNRKDQKMLNPDASDSVEEVHMDQERRDDRI